MNNNEHISYIIAKTLLNLGCKDACISPGARNSGLALNLSNCFKSYNLLDERSAGYMALGIAKQTSKPTIINCTSGTAVGNLLPSIIEARMSEIPIIIITADRPKNMINKGENQTIYQDTIFDKYILEYQAIDSSSTNIENTIHTIYKTSIGLSDNKPLHEKGPVHINVHLDEPKLSTESERCSVNKIFKNINTQTIKNDIEIKDFKSPLIICGQSNLNEYKENIFKLSDKFNTPIIADISSNIPSHPNSISYYDMFIDNMNCDTIFRFGKKPLSKKLNNLIKECNNTYLIRNEKIFNDDISNIISYKELSDFIDATHISLKTDWITSIKKQESLYISRIENIMNTATDLNEYTIAYKTLNQAENNSNIFIGNSIIIRAFNFLRRNITQKRVNIFSNRGASGIDGNIATSIGIAASSNSNHNYLILGDQAFMHDIGSLKILKNLNVNLTIIIINNSGGGIFDYLPISNKDNRDTYEKFIRNDHNEEFQMIVEAYGISYRKFDTLSDFTLPLDRGPCVVELSVNKNDSLNFYKKLTT